MIKDSRIKDIYKVLSNKTFKTTTGDRVLIDNKVFTVDTIEMLRKSDIIDDKECKLLIDTLTGKLDMDMGTRRKVKNTLKVILDNIKTDINEVSELPTVSELEKSNSEINKIRTQSNHKNKFKEALKIEENSVKNDVNIDSKRLDEKSDTVGKKQGSALDKNSEIYKGYCKQKRFISSIVKRLYIRFKQDLYSRNNIEVVLNQRLDDIVTEEKDKKSFNEIMNNKVDLVILDRNNLNIVCVVMIQDNMSIMISKAHQALRNAGVETFRVRYTTNEENITKLEESDIKIVEEMLNNKYAPTCSICGLPMRQRENIKTKHRFFACVDSINCRNTINID